MSAEVETEDGEITIASETKATAMNALLSTTAFSGRGARGPSRISRRRVDDAVKEPAKLSDEEEQSLKEVVEAMPRDEQVSSKKKSKIDIVPRVAKRGTTVTEKPAPKKTKLVDKKPKKDTGKKTGLGAKTPAVLSNRSPHKSSTSKHEAKNLNNMVNIIGQRFTWSTRGGRR